MSHQSQSALSFDSAVFHLSFRWTVKDSDTKVTHTDSNVMISGALTFVLMFGSLHESS